MEIIELQQGVAQILNENLYLVSGKCRAFAEEYVPDTDAAKTAIARIQGVALYVLVPDGSNRGPAEPGTLLFTLNPLTVRIIEVPSVTREAPERLSAARALRGVIFALHSKTCRFIGWRKVPTNEIGVVCIDANFETGFTMSAPSGASP